MLLTDYDKKEEYFAWMPNLITKPFIDDWVGRNYEKLIARFRKYRTINRNSFSPEDILQESIMRVYVDKRKVWESQEECDRILDRYFKIDKYVQQKSQSTIYETPDESEIWEVQEEIGE